MNSQPPINARTPSDGPEPLKQNGGNTPPGYEAREPGINFAQPVADNGYLWWYVDAVSGDGQQAMTLIVFVGSVFSPYYASARRKGLVPAESFCAFNTILYGPGQRKRWSMTERSSKHLSRDPDSYTLGPSSLRWDGKTLIADIDEMCVPFPKRMRGQILVKPAKLTQHSLLLDPHGRHRWHPIAPIADVEVDFPAMGVSWSGEGYLDSNEGNEPLSDGFTGWDWTRARLPGGDCVVRYEARGHDQQPHRLALRFDNDGNIHNEQPRPSVTADRTQIWRVPRRMPGAEQTLHLARTLEDTPFYARSLVKGEANGETFSGVHESLSMQRFDQSWVQTLLPFRMPRRG